MENSEVEKKRQIIERNNIYAKRALWLGIPCVLFLPYILTRFLPGDFKDTGVIGDTIGGTTAPIVGLIGAILVYLSFKQQLIANEIQIDLIRSDKRNEAATVEKELLLIYFNEIKQTTISLQYLSIHSSIINGESSIGKNAITDFIHDVGGLRESILKMSFYTSLKQLLIDVHNYLLSCKENMQLSPREREFFFERMVAFYIQNIALNKDNIVRLKEYDSTDTDSLPLSMVIDKILALTQEYDERNNYSS